MKTTAQHTSSYYFNIICLYAKVHFRMITISPESLQPHLSLVTGGLIATPVVGLQRARSYICLWHRESSQLQQSLVNEELIVTCPWSPESSQPHLSLVSGELTATTVLGIRRAHSHICRCSPEATATSVLGLRRAHSHIYPCWKSS